MSVFQGVANPRERLYTPNEGLCDQKRLITHDDAENVSDGGTGAHSGNLDGLTVAQLREIAESRGIDVPKRATKARLLELLEV